MPHVLIVDDDPLNSAILRDAAASFGFSSVIAPNLQAAQRQLVLQTPALMFVDLQVVDGNGMEMLEPVGEHNAIPVAVLTRQASLETAINALRSGAVDYLTKPVPLRQLKNLLARLQQSVAQKAKLAPMREQPGHHASTSVMLGASPAMKKLHEHIGRVAPTEATVLLLGESGTGKELVAQNIHLQSRRHTQPFLPVNCGAISPQLIESEIFGHEKGSFTGADRQHKGYFERASGGTLFLDEVVEMPIELQVKLLRVLETGSFMRIGSNQELETDVRIIAATNRDPESAIAEGRLRLDLYHRLNVFPLKIVPLRDRGSDVELLAQNFLDEFNLANGTAKQLSASARSALSQYQWPGNVRELRNYMQRAYILSDQILDATMFEPASAPRIDTALTLAIPVGTSLADVDRTLIFATLDLCGGVKKRAADLLGISLKTLYNRLEEYGSHKGGRQKIIRSSPIAPPTLPSYDKSFLN